MESVGASVIEYRMVLSAKRHTLYLIPSLRSLIQIKKRDGPSMEPWGTPEVT